MRKSRAVLIVAFLLASMLIVVLPATAEDRGEIGTISAYSGPIEKSYPQIVGVFPFKGGPQFFAYRRPPGCRTQNRAYCDAITFKVEVLSGYPEVFTIDVTLTWKAASATSDMDLFVWGDDDPALGGPIAQSQTRSPKQPEAVSLAEPDPTKFWVTVVNYDGLNNGYTLKLEWLIKDLGEGPRYRPPTRPGTSDTGTGGSAFSPKPRPRDVAEYDFDTSGPEPEITTTTIKVPGPDGELVDITLPVYALGKEKPTQGVSPFIWILAAVLVAGAATGGFFLIRRRRTTEESV